MLPLNPINAMMVKVKQFLGYSATLADIELLYWASNMLLVVQSNVGYLNEANACSQSGRHFSWCNHVEFPLNKIAMFKITQSVKAIMSSVAEAEMGHFTSTHMKQFISDKASLNFDICRSGQPSRKIIKKLMEWLTTRCNLNVSRPGISAFIGFGFIFLVAGGNEWYRLLDEMVHTTKIWDWSSWH